jgi:cysteine-rich repeat protein
MDGVLVADVKSATFDVTLGARNPCGTSGDTGKITCANKTSELGNEHIAFPVESGKTYFIVVDGVKTTDFGKFDLDVAIGPQSCGDGVVAGEACDDGNTTAGDGCSATCTLETLTGIASCPGYAITLSGSGTAVRRAKRTISTATSSGTTSGSCGGSGRDGTIAITSDVSGVMRAQLTAPWSTVLYARSSCTDTTSELACNADNPSSTVDVVRDISFAVTAGVPVFLFVDGLLGDSGTATLDISVTP